MSEANLRGQGFPQIPPCPPLLGCLPQTPPVPSSRVGLPKLTLSPSPRVDSNTLSPVSVFGPQYIENIEFVAHMKTGGGGLKTPLIGTYHPQYAENSICSAHKNGWGGVQNTFNRNLPLKVWETILSVLHYVLWIFWWSLLSHSPVTACPCNYVSHPTCILPRNYNSRGLR